jgi:hypothetical protein
MAFSGNRLGPNASNAEPPPGKDEPHLPARGKPILVSAFYFADGSISLAQTGRICESASNFDPTPIRR